MLSKIKRPASDKRGAILGHFAGEGKEPLEYEPARVQIYVPTYRWVLENKLKGDVEKILQRMHKGEKFVFLDYYTNGEVSNQDTPLSHAAVLKEYLLNKFRK